MRFLQDMTTAEASGAHYSLAHLKGHVQAPSGESGRKGNLNGDTGHGRSCLALLSLAIHEF